MLPPFMPCHFHTHGRRRVCSDLDSQVCILDRDQSTFDPTRHHQTQGIYNVGRIDKRRGFLMGTFSPSQASYEIKEIAISYTGYGAYAD
jgi:hypothetical protein